MHKCTFIWTWSRWVNALYIFIEVEIRTNKGEYRVIYKPHMYEYKEGKGVSQMSIFIHKPYSVKWSTKEIKMFKKLSIWFIDDPTL